MFKSGKKLSLTVQIFVSLVLGVIAGLLLQGHASFASTYIKPFGTIYLNLIKMVVVPVVLLSIIQGIISLQDVRRVGTIGVRTLIYFVCTTAAAGKKLSHTILFSDRSPCVRIRPCHATMENRYWSSPAKPLRPWAHSTG